MERHVGGLNVSRETFQRLEQYVELLVKWNPKINLVARSTIGDIWDRHIVDSAQIYSLASRNVTNWADFGSGGGFPGLVVAILAKELDPACKVTLVESDQRKCAFLRTVARETGCDVTVLSERVEKLDALNASVISARALADLATLLGFAERHLDSKGVCLFLKGLNWQSEVNHARDSWSFQYEATKSETNQDAVVLKVNEINNV